MTTEDRHTAPAVRVIIEDFATAIRERREKGKNPQTIVISFRNDVQNNKERDVWEVPTDLLRFRKENGRISSNVISYQFNHQPLEEKSKNAQEILKQFLDEKDPEKTEELMNAIKHSGQRDPAIVTADGFLINGNRRKLALEKLYEKTKDSRFTRMRVVILPGLNEEGGPPTEREIEEIENRYQLQSEGKSDYYNFDRALSIRQKIYKGISLDEQLRDDPNYASLDDKSFKKEKKKFEEEYLKPLEAIDRYLSFLGRNGLYDTISTGAGDREGRWQAFIDYYKHVQTKLADERKRIEIGVAESEMGDIEQIAFRIIRKREFPNYKKAHQIMRQLPKLVQIKQAREQLDKLLDIDWKLTSKESFDKNNVEYSEREKDKIWGSKYENEIFGAVKTAERIYNKEEDQQTPLALLESALKKLEHKGMVVGAIRQEDARNARNIVVKIQAVANDIERKLYSATKTKSSSPAKTKKKKRG